MFYDHLVCPDPDLICSLVNAVRLYGPIDNNKMSLINHSLSTKFGNIIISVYILMYPDPGLLPIIRGS